MMEQLLKVGQDLLKLGQWGRALCTLDSISRMDKDSIWSVESSFLTRSYLEALGKEEIADVVRAKRVRFEKMLITLTNDETTCSCAGWGLPQRWFLEAFPVMSQAAHLQVLDLSSNHIGDNGIISLCQGVSRHAVLHTLHVADCGIGDEGMLALSTCDIVDIDARYNCAGDETLFKIGERLAKRQMNAYNGVDFEKQIHNIIPKRIGEKRDLVGLFGKGIGLDGFIVVLNQLQNARHIRAADFSYNNIGSYGIKALQCTPLELQELNLTGNSMGSDLNMCVYLEHFLQSDECVTDLTLNENEMHDHSWQKAICAGMLENVTLERISLS